jgi:hypothetical protein
MRRHTSNSHRYSLHPALQADLDHSFAQLPCVEACTTIPSIRNQILLAIGERRLHWMGTKYSVVAADKSRERRKVIIIALSLKYCIVNVRYTDGL